MCACFSLTPTSVDFSFAGKFVNGVAEGMVDPSLNPISAFRLSVIQNSAVWAILNEVRQYMKSVKQLRFYIFFFLQHLDFILKIFFELKIDCHIMLFTILYFRSILKKSQTDHLLRNQHIFFPVNLLIKDS